MRQEAMQRGIHCCRTALRAMLLVLLLAAAGSGTVSAQAEKTVTGYFKDHTYVRKNMSGSLDYVDVFPPYTIVTLKVIDRIWSEYTSPKGITGYVRYDRILPVPEYERETERYVYADKQIQIRVLPVFEAPTIYTADAYELLTQDGRSGGYIHVRAEDGTAGYILPDWVKKAEFVPKPISPVTLCVGAETPLKDMPLLGAHRMETMSPDRFYTASGAFGDYYAVTTENGIRYVEKAKTAICAYRGGTGRIFFTLPRNDRKQRTDTAEGVFAYARVKTEGALLRQAGGGTRPLPEDTELYLYAGYGAWYGAVAGTEAGYVQKKDVEMLTGAAMEAWVRKKDLSGGSIERNPLLDQAFTMVEQGNPFQARYNLLTGAEIRSIFPLGIPYFWGGRNYAAITERLPKYTTREAWQSSPVFYRQGTIYLYGFDCVGFVRSVYRLAGKAITGTLSGRGAEEYCRAGTHVYCSDAHPLPEDWTEAAREMQVGDIMVIHHPGMHAMMYMGTLRAYGYTEEQLPALAKYLDYPLLFQCGENPYSYLRFQSMIRMTEDSRCASASPPDGGVGICIPGIPKEDAEMTIEVHDTVSRCFDVEGTCVTILGFGNVTDYFVYRMSPDGDVRITPGEAGAEPDETESAGDEFSAEEHPSDPDAPPEQPPAGEETAAEPETPVP